MTKPLRIVTLFLLFAFGDVLASDPVQLLSLKTHSRIILHIDENVTFERKNSPQGFEIFLKGISLADLGAPFGEEDRWKAQFKDLKDSRVTAIDFQENEKGVKLTGKWIFPTGKQALAYPSMETFDYRQSSPSPQLVFDFWVHDGPTLTEVQLAKKNAELAALVKKAQQAEKVRVARRLASEKRLAEAENSSQFCEQPLNEKWDVFLEFYPLHQKVDFSRWFPKINPDQDFHYYEPKQKTRDAQYVRLSLRFYREGKFGLVIRTLDFLDQEYPKSDFRIEMKFLRANALIRLGYHDEAIKIMQELMAVAKYSPVAVHSAMFLAGKLVEKESLLPALETFLWLTQHHSQHRLNWVFHLGAAESLYALMQTERAVKEYKWVMENAPTPEDRAEGIFRLGDVYLKRFQYELALAGYHAGERLLDQYGKAFPSFILNRGETFYQLGQYEQAKQVFEKFLDLHPSHPSGWRATFRLGEILGRTSKDKQKWEESRKWLYETVNRYPFSPGATLARLRLIPCGDHGGFNFDSQQRFFSTEAKNFDGSGEVLLKNYHDFRALAEVRALVGLGTEKQTAELAIADLQTAKNPYVKKTLTLIAHHFFQKVIQGLLDQDKKYEALTYYQERAHLIPVSEDVVDWSYLLKLSRAASDLGLGRVGEDIAHAYEKAIKPKNVTEHRGPASSEELTDIESLVRLSEQKFAEAKSLWILSKNSEDSDENIQKIKELLGEIREESQYVYDKELILGLIDEKQGRINSALAHAAKAQLLHVNLQVDYWVALLQKKAGKVDIALGLLRNLEKKLILQKKINSDQKEDLESKEPLGLPLVPSLDTLILSQGEILEQQSKWGEAAATYARGVENGWGGTQAQYEYAIALMKQGGPKRKAQAKEVLEKLVKSPGEEFWKKLAQEKLANEMSKQSIQKNAKEGVQ